MSALLETQRHFAAALRGAPGEDSLLPLLAGDAARNRALLGIYRGNAVASATAALTLACPVCRMITGDEFFDALARRYFMVAPSRDGDLNRYGATFGDFLAGFEPVRELPYLPDVARLEWSVHVAAMAADASALTGDVFAGFDADRLAAARLRVTPGFALHDSRWPVADIWLQHQADAGDAFDIDFARPQCAVVWRDGLRVRVAALDQADHAFWAAACRGAALGDAWGIAVSLDPGFNLAAAIARSLDEGWLAALDPHGENE